MKCLLLFVAASLVVVSLCENAGFKIRFTQKALDELIRTHEGVMKNQWEKAQTVFKNKMRHSHNSKWLRATGIFGESAKLKDIELISYSKGAGHKLLFEAPNVIKGSHNGMDVKFKLTIQEGGKTGSAVVDVTNFSMMMGLGLSRTTKGNIQFNVAGCNIEVERATVKIEGFGAEKDKEYTKKAQEELDAVRGVVGAMSCSQIEMVLGQANAALSEYDCRVNFPNELKDFRFHLCLTEDPKATADYMDVSFCGAVTHESRSGEGRPADFSPAPLAMSDEGTTNMFYVWEAEAVPNYMINELFKHDKLKMHICKDTYPKIAAHIKENVKEMSTMLGNPFNDNAVIKTKVEAVEAPKIDFEAQIGGQPSNSVNGKLKMRVTHKIKDCDSCDENTISRVVSIEGVVNHQVVQAEEGKMFPKLTTKVTVNELRFEESNPPIPADKLSTVQDKCKVGMQKFLEKMLNKLHEQKYKDEDKWIPPPMKIFQVKNFNLNVLKDTAEMSASLKFDVEKLSGLSHYTDQYF